MTVWNIETTRHYFSQCPACKHRLKHGFTVYTGDQRTEVNENHSVMSYSKKGMVWKGNILVLRNNGEDDVEDIDIEDFQLVTSLLQWLVSLSRYTEYVTNVTAVL